MATDEDASDVDIEITDDEALTTPSLGIGCSVAFARVCLLSFVVHGVHRLMIFQPQRLRTRPFAAVSLFTFGSRVLCEGRLELKVCLVLIHAHSD